MGSAFTKMIDSVMSRFQKESRVLLLGLDAAGKTTLLYRMNLGETIVTLPTVGFNVETVKYKNVDFTIWDVGGQDKIRPLWKHYYRGSDALIWIIDSADQDRFDLSCEELHSVLQADELRDAKLLVFANKMDLPGAANPQEIARSLRLNELRNREWYVQSCVATKGDGIYEGLDKLCDLLQG